MNKLLSLKENIKTDFTISHSISTLWTMSNFHFHDVFEVYYAMSERIKYFVNDKVFALGKGDLLVFNNTDLHKCMVPPDIAYERYVVLFSLEYIQDLCSEETDLLECFLNRNPNFCHAIHLSDEQTQALLPLFKKAEFYCNNPVYGSDIYKKITLTEILLLINSFYRSANMLCIYENEGEYKRVKPVIQYIHKNLDGNLCLENLAQKFYISKYHLGCLFKKATGFTINEYIINCRIMKARELLRKNLPVSQVGEMVGYYNVSHFIRTFKKLTGISPKQYAVKSPQNRDLNQTRVNV